MASPARAAHPLLQKTSPGLSGNSQNEVQECRFVDRRNRPLSFLELPLDILELIVKEACDCPPTHIHAILESLLTQPTSGH